MSEPKSPYIISRLLHQARTNLALAGIETAALEARVLLCHVCGITEAEVIAYPDKEIENKPAARFLHLVAQRGQRIPLAHLLGYREFWGLEFCVNAQTLIPRPETEFAVELAVKCAGDIHQKSGHVRILDLGCGTGCLLISILHEVKDASGIGVDINPQAVELAAKNAQNLSVEARTVFCCMNWGDELTETFDIIVSNPPYIRSGDIEGLMPEVSGYEPVRALDGGSDGLDEYRKIIPQARQLLNEQGVLILEIGAGQAGDVLRLLELNSFQSHSPDQPVQRDLAGCERIIVAVKVC
jgi:release factor glutamine methyltransferase